LAILINYLYPSNLRLNSEHLVSLPDSDSFIHFLSFFKSPDFGAIGNFEVWKSAFIIAIIASLETLLCVEATDKMNPSRFITPANQELFAQGLGNMVSGLIGGIPVTQVIVRSSANIQTGGKTKLSTIIHGLLLLLCAFFIPQILNLIPLSCLAAVLILVGFKLASPKIFTKVWKDGISQFIPFIVTVVSIVFTDLLTGILIGLAVGICFVLYTNFKANLVIEKTKDQTRVIFNKDVFFFNKYNLHKVLADIPNNHTVIFDGKNADFIDYDIYEHLLDFKKEAKSNRIQVEIIDIDIQKTKH
jgi:MFS superfamily sulfate permease-like transporter